jgi:hypothetical protein
MLKAHLPMFRFPRRALIALWAGLFLLPSLPVAAAVTSGPPPTDWSQVRIFQQGFATTNPLILFGFNPQPEPPAATGFWTTGGTSATRSIDGVSGDQLFVILIGLGQGSTLDLTALPRRLPVGPLLLPAVQQVRLAGPRTSSRLEIDISSSSGGFATDIVSFNPQPEPPAIFGDFDVWGLQFRISSLSTATVGFAVQDANGARVTLTDVTPPPIPLPPTLLLGLGGIAALGALRRAGRAARA